MARERTHDEILDEMCFAVNRVARHYGPSLSQDGLIELRKRLDGMGKWWCDATWMVDAIEGEEPDFHELIPDEYDIEGFYSFETVRKQSRGEPT